MKKKYVGRAQGKYGKTQLKKIAKRDKLKLKKSGKYLYAYMR